MIVTVHVLFSHNNMFGSSIIAKGSKHLEPTLPEISHTSLLINNRWVHEATGEGVKIRSYDLWLKEHKEVARVQIEDRKYQEIADKFREIQNKEYDYLGVLYLALCVGPTFFGKSLPKKNKWQSNDKFFCCECVAFLTNQNYSMNCPNQILGKLKKIYGSPI